MTTRTLTFIPLFTLIEQVYEEYKQEDSSPDFLEYLCAEVNEALHDSDLLSYWTGDDTATLALSHQVLYILEETEYRCSPAAPAVIELVAEKICAIVDERGGYTMPVLIHSGIGTLGGKA